MNIHDGRYKPLSVLNSIFFLYSCTLNSDVNTCLRATVFSLKQATAWEVLHGLFLQVITNTVEWMPGVGEKYCSQSHKAFGINLHKFVNPCTSCSFQTRLSSGCLRDLLRRAPPCLGTCGRKEQGRSLVPHVVGHQCCQEEEEAVCSQWRF